MATLALFDFMIRGGSLALLALWSWLLIRDHRAQLAARVAVAMNASIAAHIIATMPPPLGSSPLDPLFELGSVSVPACFGSLRAPGSTMPRACGGAGGWRLPRAW